MNLRAYLDEHFPRLVLEPTLFHCWPTSLRFELGDPEHKEPHKRDPAYFDPLHRRARALYEAAFAATDSCILSSVEYRCSKLGRRACHFATVFDEARERNLGIGRPSGRAWVPSGNPECKVRYVWAEVSPRRIDYDYLLRRFARTDFPLAGGGFAGTVYFINLTRNLIFHMYDDRGLDLSATKRETLKPLYDSHNSWLLDWNRERMEQMFSYSAVT
jgi:hypothetical protein